MTEWQQKMEWLVGREETSFGWGGEEHLGLCVPMDLRGRLATPCCATDCKQETFTQLGGKADRVKREQTARQLLRKPRCQEWVTQGPRTLDIRTAFCIREERRKEGNGGKTRGTCAWPWLRAKVTASCSVLMRQLSSQLNLCTVPSHHCL